MDQKERRGYMFSDLKSSKSSNFETANALGIERFELKERQKVQKITQEK